jgi:GT2 family glycosyltransferase
MFVYICNQSIDALDLSIIIVNYNVKHFLEHCLLSVEKAIQNVKAEVFVVDNNSTDGSAKFFEHNFSQFQFIYNTTNGGFAKGNNIAVPQAKGKYILFLNPDTLVPEDCFEKCIAFMNEKADAGAIGVRMIDGAGNFLKESKRAFPSPQISFYKLSGLATLFPRSAKFGRYHLGHLSEYETHEVDVLAGAFMMVRKEAIDAVGSFDEAYFMYGEDVDLSYRIQKGGYKNYYFSGTTIIHFKGESTKRGSMNYVRMFYKAMSQFVGKHFGGGKASTFNFIIQCAIFFRAGVSALRRFISWIGLALMDALVVLFCIWGTKLTWYKYIKPEVRYVREILVSGTLVYIVVYLLVSYFSGLYDKPFNQRNLNRSALVSMLVLLSIYALLPEHLRFSRGIIFVSGLVIFSALTLLRVMLSRLSLLESAKEQNETKQTIVIGTSDDYKNICHLYEKAGIKENLLGLVNTNGGEALVAYSQFDEFKQLVKFKNVVLSTNAIGLQSCIAWIQQNKQYHVKFFATAARSIISSDDKKSIGESITQHGKFAIAATGAVRLKRILDVVASIVIIIFSPILYFTTTQRNIFYVDLLKVVWGRKTLVGYILMNTDLPDLKPCLVPHFNSSNGSSPNLLYELDYRYAKNYLIWTDIKVIVRTILGK